MEKITFDSIYSIYKKGNQIGDKSHLLNLIYQTLYRMDKGSGIVNVEKGIVEMDIMGKKHRPLLLYSCIDENIYDITLLSYLFYRMKKGDNSYRFVFSYDEINNNLYRDVFVKIIKIQYGSPILLRDDVLRFMPDNTEEVIDWVLRL